MRPYAAGIMGLLSDLSLDLYGDEHPLLSPRPEIKRVATIVIAGDRGLCGGFNNNAIKEYRAHRATLSGKDEVVYAIGKRAIMALKKQNCNLIKTHQDIFDSLSFVVLREACDMLTDLYLHPDPDQRIDEVHIVHNTFVSAISQRPITKKILPLDIHALREERKAELEESNKEGEKPRPIYEVEPNIEGAINSLVMRAVSTIVYQACLESYAAELAARMNAMENATNNAGDMIDRLTLVFNRARQSAITGELLDIVGGANALQ
jgi:F-type H+-transporting ATPase subunit gamma